MLHFPVSYNAAKKDLEISGTKVSQRQIAVDYLAVKIIDRFITLKEAFEANKERLNNPQSLAGRVRLHYLNAVQVLERISQSAILALRLVVGVLDPYSVVSAKLQRSASTVAV